MTTKNNANRVREKNNANIYANLTLYYEDDDRGYYLNLNTMFVIFFILFNMENDNTKYSFFN